jgi:hypothetical protein
LAKSASLMTKPLGCELASISQRTFNPLRVLVLAISWTNGAARHELVARVLEFLHSGHDGISCHPRPHNDLRYPASPNHLCLGHGEGASLALVETLAHERPTPCNRRVRFHTG